MVEQSTTRKAVSCLVAVVMIVGFTAAPAAALTQDSILDDDIVDDDIVDTGGLDAGTADSDSGTEGVEVRIVETNSPVQTGEQLNVTVDVQSNDGGTAELLIDGESVDQQGFAPGQDDTVTFTWGTSYQDAGNHTATVQSGVDNDSTTVQVEAGMSVPEAACTNVPKRVNENVPYEQIPSQDELPEQIPNPVPPFITPSGVANIVVGAVPNQCEIQDPNNPSIDPTDPPSNPDYTVNVIRAGPYEDGGALRVYYKLALGEPGPSVSGFADGIATSNGVGANPSVNVNDGAQEYSVDPMVSGDTSTANAAADVGAPFGSVGVTVDCSGGECQPDSSGVPKFTDYPAVPQPIWTGE